MDLFFFYCSESLSFSFQLPNIQAELRQLAGKHASESHQCSRELEIANSSWKCAETGVPWRLDSMSRMSWCIGISAMSGQDGKLDALLIWGLWSSTSVLLDADTSVTVPGNRALTWASKPRLCLCQYLCCDIFPGSDALLLTLCPTPQNTHQKEL